MATQNYDHPLPSPPSHGQQQLPQQSSSSTQDYQYRQDQYQHSPHQYQQRPVQQQSGYQQEDRPRPDSGSRPKSSRSRAFSFRSDKSQKTDKSASGGHRNSHDLHETHLEKEAKRLHSKADPTLAMSEAEPSAVAQERSNLDIAPLRSIQHRDHTGAPISDPDRSNPTRSKWERPLDTIRSFEAAIDGNHSNRRSVYHRSDSDSVATFNRRSYYSTNGPRFPQDSYYGGRPDSSFRPQSNMYDPRSSMMIGGGPRDSYLETHDGGTYLSGGNGGRNRYPRMNSEPPNARLGPDKNVYPVPNNHRSNETVASGSGASASFNEPTGYQTDPTSSENSSINHRQSPPRRQEPVNDYGISFGQTPGYQPPTLANPRSQPRIMPTAPAPVAPAQPTRKESLLRKSSKLVGGGQQRPDTGETRKSWFSKRFSKGS